MDLAVKRVLLLYEILLSISGVLLLYLGDELATRNDYGFRDDPAKAADSHWVHRSAADLAALARRVDPNTLEGRVFAELACLIGLRQANPVFGAAETKIVDPRDDHVFGYVRHGGGYRALALTRAAGGRRPAPSPRASRQIHRSGHRRIHRR